MGKHKYKICTVEGCEHKHSAKGYCNGHAAQVRKHGRPVRLLIERVHGIESRLDRYIDRDGPMSILGTLCWTWSKTAPIQGYPVTHMLVEGTNKIVRVARITYERQNGEIPKSASLKSLCENRGCVNPSHHQLSSSACTKGHIYTPDNTYISPKGARSCRECVRLRHRSRYSQIKRIKVV